MRGELGQSEGCTGRACRDAARWRASDRGRGAGVGAHQVEDLPVERRQRLDVVARLEPRVRDLLDQRVLAPIRLLLGALQRLRLLYSRRVEAHLHLDRLERRRVLCEQPLGGHLDQVLHVVLVELLVQRELRRVLEHDSARHEGGERVRDRHISHAAHEDDLMDDPPDGLHGGGSAVAAGGPWRWERSGADASAAALAARGVQRSQGCRSKAWNCGGQARWVV